MEHPPLSPEAEFMLQWNLENSFPDDFNAYTARSDSSESHRNPSASDYPDPLNIPSQPPPQPPYHLASSPRLVSPRAERWATNNSAWPARSDSATTRSTNRPEPEQEGRPLDSALASVTATPPRSYAVLSPTAVHEENQRQWSHIPKAQPLVPEVNYGLHNPDRDRYQFAHQQPPTLPTLPPVGEDRSLRPPMSENDPSRSASAASKSTYRHSLFQDFDGVHHDSESAASVEDTQQKEFLNTLTFDHATIDALEGRSVRNEEFGTESFLASEPREMSFQASEVETRSLQASEAETKSFQDSEFEHESIAEVQPPDGMVFYPAPVPRNLNVPKRLSQQTNTTIVANRRSDVLSAMGMEHRASTAWMHEGDQPANEGENTKEQPTDRHRARDSKNPWMNRKLPPQLRASVFFDQQSVHHELQVKNGSAVATLDELLDASATTPAGGYSDMPHMAHGESAGWRPKKPRRTTMSLVNDLKGDSRLSRVSLISNKTASVLHQRSESQLDQRSASRLSRYSDPNWRIAEADEDKAEETNQNERENTDETTKLHQSDNEEENFEDEERDYFPSGNYAEAEDVEQEEVEEEYDEYDEYDEDEEPQYAAPTTLLAELQLRKERLKQRNRTAATAFPNGMHSTLLELDAVAQIEKKKRKGQRTALAWEDPNVAAMAAKKQDEDDDVPLGMLFPGDKGLVKKHQPIGLIAKREMDDNEPLSRRRNRLRGDTGRKLGPTLSTQDLRRAEERGEDDSPHEGETLAQRTRRLKSKKALDEVVGELESRETGNGRPSGEFESEIMSQFGGQEKNSPKATKGDIDQGATLAGQEEEETLGQRRRRLHLEGLSKGNVQGATTGMQHIQLQATHSLANLLAANPISGTRNFSNESGNTSGGGTGLVGASEQMRAERKQAMHDQNLRSAASLGLDNPLISQDAAKPGSELRGQLKEMASRPTLDTNRYNDGNGGGTNMNLVEQAHANLQTPGQALKQEPNIRGQLHAAIHKPTLDTNRFNDGNGGGSNTILVDQTNTIFNKEPELRGQVQAAMQRPTLDTNRYNDGNGGGYSYGGLVEQTPTNMQSPGQVLKSEPAIRGQLHAAYSRNDLASSNLVKFNDGTGGLASQQASNAAIAQQQMQQQQQQLQQQQQMQQMQMQHQLQQQQYYSMQPGNAYASGMTGHNPYFPVQSMYGVPPQMQAQQQQLYMAPGYPQYNYTAQPGQIAQVQSPQGQQQQQPTPYQLHYAHLQQMQAQPQGQSMSAEALMMTSQQRDTIESWRQSVL